MCKKRIILFISLVFPMLVLQSQNISRKVITTAGGTLTNGNYMLTYTIGEPIVTTLTAGDKMITQGFQQPGEQILTGLINSTSICAGNSLTVPFTATDIGGGNTFTVQLSNASGSFASPVDIGTTTGNASGNIATVIPSNIAAGSGYRIRLIASAPAVNGFDNGSNLVITPVTTTTTSITACDTFTWPINSQTYTANGTYTYENGCHTEVLNLTLACASVVNLKLYIEGYYEDSNNAMQSVAVNQGLGSNLSDVDNVTLELRNNTGQLFATTSTLLNTDGTAIATFDVTPSGSYYLVIKHRNALQTWSATPQTIGAIPLNYDFTTAASKAYGNNMRQVEPGVWALYSGDLDGDGFIDIPDFALWETDYNNGAIGVFPTDLDGDGFVDIPDYAIWEQNYNNSVFSIYPTN